MNVAYCYQWNDLTKEPRDPYAEAEARQRHERGELYTALLGDPSAPHTLVEVRLDTGYVGVHFLDDELRRWSTYSFGRSDEKTLFLKQYRRAEYDSDGRQVAAEIINFREDGVLTVQKADLVKNVVDQYDVHADVSSNWEPTPAFGDYESIARFDR